MDVLFKLVEARFGFTLKQPLKGVVPHIVMMSIRDEVVETTNVDGHPTYELCKGYNESVVKKFLSRLLTTTACNIAQMKTKYNTLTLTDDEWWGLMTTTLTNYHGNSFYNQAYLEDADRLLHEHYLDKELIAKRLAGSLGKPELQIHIDPLGCCIQFMNTTLDSEEIQLFERRSKNEYMFGGETFGTKVDRNYHELNGNVYCLYDGLFKEDNEYGGLLGELHNVIRRTNIQ